MASSQIEHVSRRCKCCGNQFSFENTRGKTRSYCSRACVAKVSRRAFRARAAVAPRCKVDGCASARKTVRHGLCAKHEARVRRGGSTALRRVDPTVYVDKRGYVRVKRPDLPISGDGGWVYEHRAIGFDKYGYGEHPCHWCGGLVSWDTNVIDHMDENKGNNSPGNLVMSCNPCNRARGAMVPFVRSLSSEGLAELVASLALMRRTT